MKPIKMRKKILIEEENILLDAITASMSPIFRRELSSAHDPDKDFASIKSNLINEIEDKKQLKKALEELEATKTTGFYFSVKDEFSSFTQSFTEETDAKKVWLMIATLIKEANNG